MATGETLTTYTVQITFAFADATSRTLKFSGVESDVLSEVKDKVLALNANYPEAVANTFVSSIGTKSTMISKAQIVQKTTEVIYSAN